MYRYIIRPTLALMNPQTVRKIIVNVLLCAQNTHVFKAFSRLRNGKTAPSLGRDLFGLHFSNPLGAAAGLDQDGEIYNVLGEMGFSFVEIGSITPEKQSPQIETSYDFKAKAVKHPNFAPSKGVHYVIDQLRKRPKNVIVAANLAPNMVSSKQLDSAKDYQTSFSLLYDFVDMFIVNVSCTNRDGLDPIQELSDFKEIMEPILDLRLCYGQDKPILAKISPDTTHKNLDCILDYCMLNGIDGIVAGNSSKSEGGISGAPIYEKTLEQVRYIHEYTKGRFPIIGCGGIMSAEDAAKMVEAGASLVQICSGLIFKGPRLIKEILKKLQFTSENS